MLNHSREMSKDISAEPGKYPLLCFYKHVLKWLGKLPNKFKFNIKLVHEFPKSTKNASRWRYSHSIGSYWYFKFSGHF